MQIDWMRIRGAAVAVAVTAAGLATVAVLPSAPAGALAAPCDRIAWTGDDGVTPQVWVADDDGTSRALISDVSTGLDPIDNRSVSWSSSGSSIAWSGKNGPADEDYDVYVSDASGSARLPLTSVVTTEFPKLNGSADWSPDDSKIVWSGHDGFNFEIFVASATGASRQDISSVVSSPSLTVNRDPHWSPDGTQITWSGRDGTEKIWIASVDGNSRVLVSGADVGAPTVNRFPRWSPDGTKIAWSGLDSVSATEQIWVADIDGTNRMLVSTAGVGTDPTANKFPRWSPDGSSLAWSGHDSGTATEQVWVADAAGTNRLAISAVDAVSAPTVNQNPDWSPDGLRIAWQGTRVEAKIWVANADGTARTAISDADPDPDPTSNQSPVWRSRVGVVALSAPVVPLVVGTSVDLTVTATTTCTTASIEIHGLSLACLGSVTSTATLGSVSASGVWSIDVLDGSASATISGTVLPSGACAGTVSVAASAPAEMTASSVMIGRVGPDALPPCDSSPTPFGDIAGSFAAVDVACIYHLEITSGLPGGLLYGPAGLVTREQMASFLARLWMKAGGLCDSSPTPFGDIAGSFAAVDVACIYNLGVTSGLPGGLLYGPSDSVTREQMAAFLARMWRLIVNHELRPV